MPDVSDRHTDTQLAALGLAMLGIEHPRTNHGELELTDAALHTEQQAIVRTTRVIHALHVDYSRLDQTTKLEQMMPVSTVARQPRSIQAQHRADISSTDGSDEPIEAGSAHRAARGASKIVVNYFNVDEAMPPRHFNQIVLPTLTLQVRLHLCLRGLTDIDHGLALQERCWQYLSAHRCSPRPRSRPPASICGPGSLWPSFARLETGHEGPSTRTQYSSGAARRVAVSVRSVSCAVCSSRFSWTTGESSQQLRRNPRSRRSRCSSLRASIEICGAPRAMPAQTLASAIQSGNIITVPGVTSTWITRPLARCSLCCTRNLWP